MASLMPERTSLVADVVAPPAIDFASSVTGIQDDAILIHREKLLLIALGVIPLGSTSSRTTSGSTAARTRANSTDSRTNERTETFRYANRSDPAGLSSRATADVGVGSASAVRNV
ncbi:MAG: hypothetical protein VX815_11380 [Gemmatimonadota bacterium]|nr:hypothetical protein [Gemmatimonadota bacterium]